MLFEPPSCWEKVTDPSDEIFFLYTQKESSVFEEQQSSLGLISSNSDVLSVSLEIKPASIREKSFVKKKEKKKVPNLVNVDVELLQDLNVLRSHKGDTGSVLWRASVCLAEFILKRHHFPSSYSEKALPLIQQSSRILELGSGNGFLGIALAPTVQYWSFSDQQHLLKLIARNCAHNNLSPSLFSIQEIDWLEYNTRSTAVEVSGSTKKEGFPDVIIASDCIYNPALSKPLARTIDAYSGPDTFVLIMTELRDPDHLEQFLEEFMSLNWEIWRLVTEEIDSRFVLWVGRHVQTNTE